MSFIHIVSERRLIFTPFGQKNMNTNTENRVVFHTTRFAPDEAAEIVAHVYATGQSVSALIRARVLGHALPKGAAPALNLAAWRELASTAANLNQLAHHFNLATQAGNSPPNIIQVQHHLDDLQAKLKAVRLQLIGAEK
jgi:hypothetical protein